MIYIHNMKVYAGTQPKGPFKASVSSLNDWHNPYLEVFGTLLSTVGLDLKRSQKLSDFITLWWWVWLRSTSTSPICGDFKPSANDPRTRKTKHQNNWYPFLPSNTVGVVSYCRDTCWWRRKRHTLFFWLFSIWHTKR